MLPWFVSEFFKVCFVLIELVIEFCDFGVLVLNDGLIMAPFFNIPIAEHLLQLTFVLLVDPNQLLILVLELIEIPIEVAFSVLHA